MLRKQRRRRSRKADESPTEAEVDEGSGAVVQIANQPGLWLYLAVPVAGILLCGSREPWALGVLSLMVGLTACFATPMRRVSPYVMVPVLLALLLCLAAFLPASWFPTPAWKETLQKDFGFILASTRSPQPWITLESWLLLALGAVWFVCCLARGFSSAERRTIIRVLTAFIALLACVAMGFRYWKIEVPFWRGPWDLPYFGPFPNRNHFSGLLAVGAVLSFAATYDAFRRKSRIWMPLALAIIPIFAAVLLNTSRMGVIVFFVGVGAWMFTATFQKRSAHRVAVSAAVLLVMAAAFLLFGGHIIERFSSQGGSVVTTLSQEGRLRMFADAVVMISRAPIFGIGLGNFEPVFAMTRPQGDLYSRAVHPENDWLWFGAEAGLPCLLLGIIVVAVLVHRTGPWRTHDISGRRDRRLRNGAGIGVLLLCVEGMADTPMHAPGFFVLGCLLAGLALHPSAYEDAAPGAWTLPLRKVVGVLCLLCGLAWMLTAYGIPVVRGNSHYRQLAREAATLSARGDAAGALETWNKAAALKPLQWHIYFERAMLKLRLGLSSREAMEDFNRSRRLEPHSALLGCREFDVWQEYDPVYGVPALREAMKRDPGRAVEFFNGRVGNVVAHPELRSHLRALAEPDPKLLLAYLPYATKEEFHVLIESLLTQEPSLAVYTPEEKLRFFRVWHDKGDSARLIQMLEENLNWRQDGWTVLAEHRAKEGNFRAAYEVAISNVTAPPGPGARRNGNLADLDRAFRVNPTDFARGLDLYETQRQLGHYDEALATLDQLAQLPQAPAKILYERGVTLAGKGDYARAWDAVSAYAKRVEQERKDL